MRIDGYCRIYGSSQSENICPIIAKSIGHNGGQSNFEFVICQSSLLKKFLKEFLSFDGILSLSTDGFKTVPIIRNPTFFILT